MIDDEAAGLGSSQRTAISTASDQFVLGIAFPSSPVARQRRMIKEAPPAQKVQMICGTCGSTDISRDAWDEWDVAAQEWVLRTVFDYAHCHDCDGETRLVEIALAPTR